MKVYSKSKLEIPDNIDIGSKGGPSMKFKLRFKLHSLSCCFLGLLVSVTGHTQTSAPQVKFAGSLEAANAAPGRVVRAVFETTLPRGFHVNSNTPSDEFLKPTSLLLDTPAGVKIGRIDYPEPRPFKAEFSKEPLAVYEEHFVIGADLEIDEDLAPGDYPVKATLKYQVCSARVCYPPATRSAEIILALAARRQPLHRPRHRPKLRNRRRSPSKVAPMSYCAARRPSRACAFHWRLCRNLWPTCCCPTSEGETFSPEKCKLLTSAGRRPKRESNF